MPVFTRESSNCVLIFHHLTLASNCPPYTGLHSEQAHVAFSGQMTEHDRLCSVVEQTGASLSVHSIGFPRS